MKTITNENSQKTFLDNQITLKKLHKHLFWLTNIFFIIISIMFVALIIRSVAFLQKHNELKSYIFYGFAFWLLALFLFSYHHYVWYKKNHSFKRFLKAKSFKEINWNAKNHEQHFNFLNKHYLFLTAITYLFGILIFATILAFVILI